MHTPYAVLIAALLATAAASPVEKRESFTVHTKRDAPTGPHAGHHAMVKAFRKYGWKYPHSGANLTTTVSRVAKPQVGSVAALPVGQPGAGIREYLENVNVGGQKLTLDFDTGSSDLWVFSSLLPAASRDGHLFFSSQKSKTFRPLNGFSWKIMYGDGSGALGVVGTDTVTIGGTTVKNQAVELATNVAAEFTQDILNDGLVGLAFGTLNTVQPQAQKTFFENAMPTLPLPIFSVDLTNDNTGTYTFGALDKSKFQGDLTDVPVNSSSGFWQVTSNSYAINGKVFRNPDASPAIADTGTTLLLVDPPVAKAYYSQVQGSVFDANAGGVIYPCNSNLPDFSVAIGDQYMALIPGTQLTQSFAGVSRKGVEMCFGGIQDNAGSGLQIYGDVLFRSQYVVFDGKVPKLQLAPKP